MTLLKQLINSILIFFDFKNISDKTIMNDSDDNLSQIRETIKTFQQTLQSHLPALESEINAIITNKEQNKNNIEYSLDVLISLTDMGIGNELFIKLLDNYKTIDAERASFYWEEYDKKVESFKSSDENKNI